MAWKGIKRQWDETEEDNFSADLFDSNWLPIIPRHAEENEDGSLKQIFILIEDIPDIFRDEFVEDENKKIQQIARYIETEEESVIADETTLCVDEKTWEKWLKKKLKG